MYTLDPRQWKLGAEVLGRGQSLRAAGDQEEVRPGLCVWLQTLRLE